MSLELTSISAIDGSQQAHNVQVRYFGDPVSRNWSFSLGYWATPYWQVGVQAAPPMPPTTPYGVIELPMLGEATYRIHRRGMAGVWNAVNLLPLLRPAYFGRSTLQLGLSYQMRQISIEEDLSISGRYNAQNDLEMISVATIRQHNETVHNVGAFLRFRHRISRHLTLMTTLERSWGLNESLPVRFRSPTHPGNETDIAAFELRRGPVSHDYLSFRAGLEVGW